ncbi:polyprenyl synthetase family protein [Nocardia blacklockiae]|uniref:polyprenyl synthetase family protein n=1 Tax=Nocardia blacklockiae TaxID=480036 RepID=UPI001893E26E|nr:polyprenyl synthetase family protein [Nocardia blacklockiae]MBF6174762.1 polyprenyl synthetase family protein [Nocardia blacklockiae]
MTTTTLSAVGTGSDAVRAALREAVSRLDETIRPVVSYHFGWSDQHGQPVEGNGGKSIRSRLALLAAEATGGDAAAAVPGAVAVELVHNFSLVHDDLMDRDTTRRHRATVWALWGDPVAVLAGDAMLALAHEVLLDCGAPQAVPAARVVGTATRELIRGQAADVEFEQRSEVSLAECVRMAAGKTAALLSASAAVGAVLAGARPRTVTAMEHYGHHVGLAFQLVDDLLGIWGEPEVTGKPVWSDLRSRKKSLPVVWTLEAGGTTGHELAQWLSRPEPPDEESLRHAADLVDRGGGRRWARNEARRRVALAEQSLAAVPMPPQSRRELTDLAEFIVERSA